IFLFLFFLISINLMVFRNLWHAGNTGWFMPLVRLYYPWLWLALSIPVGVAAFYVGEPMAWFDPHEFGKSISEQARIITTGEAKVVYTLQYNHTPGVFYLIDNLFYPSLDWVTAFFVVLGMCYSALRMVIN